MSTSKSKKNKHNPPQSGHPNLCTGLSPGMSVGSSKTSQCQCLGQAAKHSRSSARPATLSIPESLSILGSMLKLHGTKIRP